MGSPKQKTKSNVNQAVSGPAWLMPSLEESAVQARTLYHQYDATPFGSTLVPFSPETEQSLTQRTNLANAGSPVVAANTQNITDTLSGKYLDPSTNPWLAEIVKRSGYDAENRIHTQYESGGRGGLGSGVWQGALADALTGNSAQLYGQNYSNERQRMMGASALAPQADAIRYNDANVLGDVGAQREDLTARTIADRYQQWAAPMENLQNFIMNLRGNPGVAYTNTRTDGSQSSYKTGSYDWGGLLTGLLNPGPGLMGGGK